MGGPHETTSDRRPNDTHKRQDKRAFSETGVDCTGQVLTHTLGILHGSGAQFVEAADPGEAAESRGRERRQQSRSGEDPDHQENRAERNETSHTGEDQPQDCTSRFRRIRTQTKLLM